MARHSARYREVLASERFYWTKREAGRRCKWRCQDCGKKTRLDAHHWRGYSMLGREQPEDLRMLCRPCHDRAHGRGGFTLRGVLPVVFRASLALIFLAMLAHSVGVGRS